MASVFVIINVQPKNKYTKEFAINEWYSIFEVFCIFANECLMIEKVIYYIISISETIICSNFFIDNSISMKRLKLNNQ